MGLFTWIKRLSNLGQGKVDRAVEQAEKNDPDAIFRSAIVEAEKDVAELRTLSREAKGLVRTKKSEIEALENERKELKRDLALAIEKEDEELGTDLIGREERVDREIKAAKAQLEDLDKEAEITLKAFDARVQELTELREEQSKAAQMEKAHKVMSSIRDRRDGITRDATSQALKVARDKINMIQADREATLEVGEKSLEGRREALRAESSRADQKAKFQELLAKKKG
jgi:phage shock protein A